MKACKDFVSRHCEVNATLQHWPRIPPLNYIPAAATDWDNREVDPVPGIFQQIVAIAKVTAPSPPLTESESDEANTSSSGWNSEDSETVEMEDNLELKAVMMLTVRCMYKTHTNDQSEVTNDLRRSEGARTGFPCD